MKNTYPMYRMQSVVQVQALANNTGNTETNRNLNSINTLLTQISTQAETDRKYDPPPPKPEKDGYIMQNNKIIKTIESFDNYQSVHNALFVVGSLFLIYSIISKA
jgi:hypothetical protein